jgi:GNAT superfamily N-acetyltransferase
MTSAGARDEIEAEAIEMRIATMKDAKVVADLLRESFAEFKELYTPRGFAATTPQPSIIRGRMRVGVTWIASIGTVASGTVTAVPLQDDSVYVRSMAVIPSARGLGIGRALLNQAEEFARGRGVRRMILNTTPFLESAIHLYESSGFRLTKGCRSDLHGTPLLSMEKILERRP